MCQCDCSKSHVVFGGNLRAGEVKSCGCLKRQKSKNSTKWHGHADISGTYFQSLKHGAAERGIPFNISIEQMWTQFQKQEGRCALSGVPLKWPPSRKAVTEQTASLDRIDSGRGYGLDNIQWVHKELQPMKMAMEQEKFLAWNDLIYQFQHRNE
jgi:hypothetical protein